MAGSPVFYGKVAFFLATATQYVACNPYLIVTIFLGKSQYVLR